MADNITLNAGTGGSTLAADDIASVWYQIVKLGIGALDSVTLLTGNIGTVDGGTVRVTLATDVALPAGTNAIGKLAANSGVDIGDVDVTSVSGNVTVVNAGTFAVQADTELTTGDLDTGAGTDTRAVIGLVGSKSGGGEIIPGSATDGLLVNLGANNDVTVTGTVTANPASGTITTVSTVSALGNSTTGPQKAEDVASANADVGIPAMAVQKATPANTAGTDGDYEFLQISAGRLWASTKIDTALPAGTNLVGDVDLQPRATGGLTTFMASGSDGSSILVATAQVIKASAGKLYGYYAYNPEVAVTFVHFYNTAAASVTVGTTSPLWTIAIPAESAANLNIPQGITFSNAGWSCAATTTAGGNTAPATGVSLVVWYA